MAAHLTPSLGSDYVWGPTLGSANVGDEQRLWRIINVSFHDMVAPGLHVSDREDCRGQVDADWGWGYKEMQL